MPIWHWRWQPRRRSGCDCSRRPPALWSGIRWCLHRWRTAWTRSRRDARSHRGARLHFDAEHWQAARPRRAHARGDPRSSPIARRRRGRVRTDADPPEEPQCDAPTPVYMLAAGPRMIELAGEVADGAFLFVGLHPAAVRAARHHLEDGAEAGWALVGRLSGGVRGHPRSRRRCEVGARWVRSWFAPGQPFLAYPSVSNLRWLREAGLDLDEAHDPAAIPEDRARQIADAFGLFGSPERCAERLLRAREEAGVDNVFLFPAHDLAGGYAIPEAEVRAFAKVIYPRLGA